MKKLAFTLSLVVLLLAACEKEKAAALPNELSASMNRADECSNSGCALDRIYQIKGQTYLYAGSDSSTHFNITAWLLTAENLRDHGLSREAFPALYQPRYQALREISTLYPPNSEVLIVKGQSEVRAYPFSLMTFHEVINDVIDGEPYMAAYCVLADFAAAYSRRICDQVLTFGVSGYTYLNPNYPNDPIQAFILWDRETESLWNPLEDLGVSHLLQNRHLPRLPARQWQVLSWAELISTYPEAQVLKAGQELEAPFKWHKLSCQELSCCD